MYAVYYQGFSKENSTELDTISEYAEWRLWTEDKKSEEMQLL